MSEENKTPDIHAELAPPAEERASEVVDRLPAQTEETYKIRYKHSVRGICLLRHVPASSLQKTIDELATDDKILKIEHYEETPVVAPKSAPSAEELRSSKAGMAKAYAIAGNTHKSEVAMISRESVASSAPYFSRPYSIDQIDILDKVQVQNLALAILADPAEGVFPLNLECTIEQLTAKTEFHLAKFNKCMDDLRVARKKLGIATVDKMRGEHEEHVKEKVKRREQKLKPKSGTATETLSKANEAKKLGGSPKHKKLLAFVVQMGLDIPNYTTMDETTLQAAVEAAMKS